MKILCLCDSPDPDMESGFTRVARNLFLRWAASTNPRVQVDVWGIGYRGKPHDLPFRIWPGGMGGSWGTPEKLLEFLDLIEEGDYSHVWLMQDTFKLSGNFVPALMRVCGRRGIKLIGYFPIDADMVEPKWLDIVSAMDFPVAYTQFGKEVTLEAMANGKWKIANSRNERRALRVIPHGVDTRCFHPLGARKLLRHELFNGWLEDNDFLIVNVSAHQRRKDVFRTMEICAGLIHAGFRAKLIMHMGEHSGDEMAGAGTSLELMAQQLRLERGRDWNHNGHCFAGWRPKLPEAALNQLYNAADLFLTTTLGEGWGLPMVEALAAGTAVAAPAHTACKEIMDRLQCEHMDRIIPLPVEEGGIVLPGDNSRIRHRVNLEAAVQVIGNHIYSLAGMADGKLKMAKRNGLSESARNWLCWDRIAEEFLSIMREPKPMPVIKAFMLSCPSREIVRQETLNRLATLTDWGETPFVRIDQGKAERLQDRQEQNALALLIEALEGSAWDYMLFLEDDLAFNAHLRWNLNNWWPIVSRQLEFGSLYNPTVQERPKSRDSALNFFLADPSAVYGSQAFVISNLCARYIVEHWRTIPGMQDIKCSRLAAKFGGGMIYYHSPSLVQHVDAKSTWGGVVHTTNEFSIDFKARKLTAEDLQKAAQLGKKR